MRRKSVLVTGGAGYIGSHTAKALAAAGFFPVVVDTLALGHRWAVKWGPLIQGDVADERLLTHVFQKYDVRAVIHFAGSAYVGESMNDPRKYLNNNVANCLPLLNAIIDNNIRAFVFSSSCATYGNPQYLPIDENHPQLPISPYGESKLFIEKVLHWYGCAHDLRFASLRYFNAAGADPAGELGENHTPETHLIPLAIQAATGARSHVTVFGTDFPTADGTAVRDYVHVSDLADAHVRALHFLENGGSSGAFNLGVGTGYSVREVIGCVERITGSSIMALEAPRRPGDPAVLVASSAKAAATLGWRPVHTRLEDLIATALHWDEARRSQTLHSAREVEQDPIPMELMSATNLHDA